MDLLQTLIIEIRTWMKAQAEVVVKKDSQLNKSKRKLTASIKAAAAVTEQAQILKDRI